MNGVYVALVRDGRGLLTGRIDSGRALQLVAENPGAYVIEAPDRATAFQLAHEATR